MDATIELEYIMSEEELYESSIGHPMDEFIAVALCVDEDDVQILHVIVSKAVNRLEWELENTPYRWTKVKAAREVQLAHWTFLQDKLLDYWRAIHPIPF